MRTTISLDDRLAAQVRRRAHESGVSVSAFIAAILDEALKSKPLRHEHRRFRLITVGGGGPRSDVDLDRPRSMDVEEDVRRYRSAGKSSDC